MNFQLTTTTPLLLLLLSLPVAALQDPLLTLPDAYRLQFENDWVKVVRVHYPAGATLADHTHPAGTTAYVYLNDSSGVVFRHSGTSNSAITRPPVTAGSVRVASGREEHHTAENPAATPSDFLRVQFKTTAAGGRNARHRVPRGSYAAGQTVNDVQFTNAQMRLTRIILPAGQSAALITAAAEPALLIALSPATLSLTGGPQVTLSLGQEHWVDASQNGRITNAGAESMELLRVDFLTPPS